MGPHTVDRFANHENSQLLVFNSKRSCPGTSGTDAFSFNWADGNNWLCPPISLILRAIDKVRSDLAMTTYWFHGGKVSSSGR